MTSTEAARILNVNQSRIRQLCGSGRIHAVKQGRDWWITDAEVERFAAAPRRKAGRPSSKSSSS